MGLLEGFPGRPQVLTEGNSRSHHEEKGKVMRDEGARVAWPGVYTGMQKEHEEA